MSVISKTYSCSQNILELLNILKMFHSLQVKRINRSNKNVLYMLLYKL